MTIRRRDFRDTPRFLAAVASELAAPLLGVAARVAVPSPPSAPVEWRNGLILGNGHIGDVLYRTASLELLADGLHACQWTYLTTPFAAEVLVGNPAVAEVLPWMTRAEPESALAAHATELRARRFDAVLCTEGIRPHAQLGMAMALRIPNRVAFTNKGMSGLTTIGVPLEQPLPRAAQFRRMAEQITGMRSTRTLRPRVFPSAEEIDAAHREWERLGLADASLVIACSVTTRQHVGGIPVDFFRSVLERAVARAPELRVVFVGAAGDAAALQPIARALGAAGMVSAGALGVRAMVPFLTRCRAFLGTDSGARHLANAAGIPVVYVRNLATSAIETGTYLPTEIDLAPHGEYLSPDGVLRAIAEIDIDAAARTLVSAAERATGTDPDTPP